jgi:hypothetical protein
MLKRKKQTVIVIDWESKGGSRSLKTTTTGAKMPDDIKVMLANQFLRDLRGKIDLDVRPL